MPFAGGCDKLSEVAVPILLLVASLLMLFYVSQFVIDKKILSQGKESVCGGMDQGCVCNGNEKMHAEHTKHAKHVSDSDLSLLSSGDQLHP